MAIITTSTAPSRIAGPTPGAVAKGAKKPPAPQGGTRTGATTGGSLPLVNDILNGKQAIPNPTNNPTLALTNSLLGGQGGTLAQQQAGITAQEAQLAAAGAQTGLSNTTSQQSAANQLAQLGISNQELALQGNELNQQGGQARKQQGYESQQYSLGQQSTKQGIANAATQQSAELANYNLQYGSDPNSAYSLAQQGNVLSGQSIQNQLANLTAQYGFQVPAMNSSAAASGAGNSGANQAAKASAAETYNYNTTQGKNQLTANTLAGNQLTNQKQQADIGQKAEVSNYNTSAKQAQEALKSSQIGQQAQTSAYKYSQKQLANQKTGLTLAQKASGLNEQQIKNTLSSAISQANLGGSISADQLLADIASGNANQVQTVLNAVGQTALAQQLTAAARNNTKPTKGKK